MYLNELMRNLSNLELSGLFMSESGNIDESSFPRILMAVNSALTDLYTRFVLSEKELHILCLANKTVYKLSPEFATMNPCKGIKYILDTPEYPFQGDLIKILRVSDEVGNTLAINDMGNRSSVFIPRYDTIQVNYPANDMLISVTYQANHPKLILENCDDVYFNRDLQYIDIPPALEEALRVRTAFHIFSAMERKENSAQIANLASRYEMLCAQAEQRNLLNDSTLTTTSKLQYRGFV